MKDKEEKIAENFKLIPVERHKMLNKILVIVTIAIVVIVVSSIAGIFVARNMRQNGEEKSQITENQVEQENTEKYNNSVENNVAENQVEQEENAEKDTENQSGEGKNVEQDNQVAEESKPLLPVYSEEAKQNFKNIYVSNDDEKVAYLTFDDGPSKQITPQILEILRNENIKASFFVLGNRVETYPDLVKQEYEEGHYIANHGYSHVYTSVYASSQAVLDEYNTTENKIKEAIGVPEYSSHIFRFPGGSEGGKYAKIKNEAKSVLEQNDVLYVNWNALTNDAVGKPTHESLVQDLKSTSNGKNKIVVLMHDTGSKQLTADTLPEVISYLREQGYVFKNFYDIMK